MTDTTDHNGTFRTRNSRLGAAHDALDAARADAKVDYDAAIDAAYADYDAAIAAAPGKWSHPQHQEDPTMPDALEAARDALEAAREAYDAYAGTVGGLAAFNAAYNALVARIDAARIVAYNDAYNAAVRDDGGQR